MFNLVCIQQPIFEGKPPNFKRIGYQLQGMKLYYYDNSYPWTLDQKLAKVYSYDTALDILLHWNLKHTVLGGNHTSGCMEILEAIK